MHYDSFTRIRVRIVSIFHPLRQVFFSPRTRFFFTVTTFEDWLFHRTYQFLYHTRVRPFVQISVTIRSSIPGLCIFTIWRVVGWQRSMRRPPRMRMQNGPPFIIDRSSPGGVLRYGVFHKFSNIYTPQPKTAPDQGMLNRYFPSRETPQRWIACPCSSDLRLGVGGCCVVSLTHTLRHGDIKTPPKTTFYITCGTSLTCAAPKNTVRSLYVFGWCLCQSFHHFIF